MKIAMLRFVGMISLALMMAGCTKYEDGPAISFRSRESRLAQNWIATQVFRNQIDESSQYLVYNMIFDKGGRLNWRIQTPTTPLVESGSAWEFAVVDEQIKLTLDPVNGETKLLYIEIRRLTGDELWIHFLTEGDYYDVRFRPA
ncbi:MAG: hypothetical protein SF053_06150 [Bacteroidia bacterium]|nr:hypothetical protein [Bacteroidia bacterium]